MEVRSDVRSIAVRRDRIRSLSLAAGGRRGGFGDEPHEAVASTIGCTRSGRTVMAIRTPAMPIVEDAT